MDCEGDKGNRIGCGYDGGKGDRDRSDGVWGYEGGKEEKDQSNWVWGMKGVEGEISIGWSIGY